MEIEKLRQKQFKGEELTDDEIQELINDSEAQKQEECQRMAQQGM